MSRSCRAALATAALALGLPAVLASAADGDRFLDGTIAVVWGDPAPAGPGDVSPVRLRLTTDNGTSFVLDAAGLEGRLLASPVSLAGRRARVWLDSPPQDVREGRLLALLRRVAFGWPPFRWFFEREVFAVAWQEPAR